MSNRFRGLLLIIFFISAEYLPAQNKSAVDSILVIADRSETPERIRHYLNIADIYLLKEPETALKYCNEASVLANNSGQEKLEAEVLKKTASVYLQMNKFNLAEQFFKKALDICIANKNTKGISENYHNLGTVYAKNGEFEKAKLYFNKALNIAIDNLDTNQRAASSLSLGNVYIKQGNYEQALHFYNASLVLIESDSNSLPEKARLYNNLGVLFSEQGKYKKSLEYYEKASQIYGKLKNQYELGKTYNNMGTIYWYTDDIEKASSFYMKSMEIRKEQKDISGEAYVLNNLGMLYGSGGDFELALKYFEKSLMLFESQYNRTGSLLSTYNLGEVYMALGQFKNAEKHYHQSLSIAQQDGALDYELENLNQLTELYKQNKDFKKAVEVYSLYISLNDSIDKFSNTDQMIEMEARFDQEKKKTTLAFLQEKVDNENKKSKRIHWAIGIISLIYILTIVGLIYISRKQNLKAEHQKHLLSQQFLQYQMNPNFLHHSLNYIRDFLYKNKTQEAGAYLSSFARLIRTFIEHSTSEKISLEVEMETIEHYFKLRKAGYESEFTYQIEMDQDLEPEFIQIPPFMLFPFIDVLLGRFGIRDLLHIKLHLYATENHLLYNVAIDFSGSHYLDVEDIRQTFDNTSESAEHRLELIHKLTKEKMELEYKLDINTDNKKLLLMLTIPLSF